MTTCHFTIIVLAMTGENPLGWVLEKSVLLEFDSLAQYSAMLRVIPDTGHLVCPLRLGLPLSPTKIATLFKYPKMYESCLHISPYFCTTKQLHMPSRPKNCPEKHLPAYPRVVRWPLPKRICNEVMSFLPVPKVPKCTCRHVGKICCFFRKRYKNLSNYLYVGWIGRETSRGGNVNFSKVSQTQCTAGCSYSHEADKLSSMSMRAKIVL